MTHVSCPKDPQQAGLPVEAGVPSPSRWARAATPARGRNGVPGLRYPLSGFLPEITTGFGSVQLSGHYESVIIDSDLVAHGMGGRVLANAPTSQDTGYG